MEKNDVKFFDVIVVGKMYKMGSSKCLYCIVRYEDVSCLKLVDGEVLPVLYVSSYYDYKIGDTVLLVVDKDKMSLYNKKGGKKVDVK